MGEIVRAVPAGFSNAGEAGRVPYMVTNITYDGSSFHVKLFPKYVRSSGAPPYTHPLIDYCARNLSYLSYIC